MQQRIKVEAEVEFRKFEQQYLMNLPYSASVSLIFEAFKNGYYTCYLKYRCDLRD